MLNVPVQRYRSLTSHTCPLVHEWIWTALTRYLYITTTSDNFNSTNRYTYIKISELPSKKVWKGRNQQLFFSPSWTINSDQSPVPRQGLHVTQDHTDVGQLKLVIVAKGILATTSSCSKLSGPPILLSTRHCHYRSASHSPAALRNLFHYVVVYSFTKKILIAL